MYQGPDQSDRPLRFHVVKSTEERKGFEGQGKVWSLKGKLRGY